MRRRVAPLAERRGAGVRRMRRECAACGGGSPRAAESRRMRLGDVGRGCAARGEDAPYEAESRPTGRPSRRGGDPRTLGSRYGTAASAPAIRSFHSGNGVFDGSRWLPR